MYTIRDYQSRVNGILNSYVLVVDGISGPKTRSGIARAMKKIGVRKKEDLFNRGVRGIVWHWTAGAKGFIELEKNSYNFLFSVDGDSIQGNHTIAEQVMYDWRNKIGASHTKSMNTGWIGCSVDAMNGAVQKNPVSWGSNPITWDGIDSMLEMSAEIAKEYEIPISKWTTLTHAEVQPVLGVKQRWKWDFTILPHQTNALQDPVDIGNILRKRLIDKFM